MEYTKGKWKYTDLLFIGVQVFDDRVGCGKVIADTQFYNDNVKHPLSLRERKANAHLIAAAPQMYETLNNLVSRLNLGMALGEALDLTPARKALAKAEGK